MTTVVNDNACIRNLGGDAGSVGLDDGTRRVVRYTGDTTLVLADLGSIVECDSESPITITVPAFTDVPYTEGIFFDLVQIGNGSVTVIGDTGVTIASNLNILNRVNSSAFLYRSKEVNHFILSNAPPADWNTILNMPVIDKSFVGLGNVDNTSDSAKIVLSASKLTTARNINGVSFDGTASITVADLALSEVVNYLGIKTSKLTNPTNIVSQPSLANLADPNVTDSVVPTFADQLWRVYNSGTGLASAQSSSTLGSFAVTRKYPVTAGTTYTISMHGAPSDYFFYFSGTPTITFYNGSGTFVTGLTTFTSSYGGRELTFTVPVGCSKVAFNVRDSVDFSNLVPMDSVALQTCLNNIMLNVGSSALAWSAYTTGTYSPSTALFSEGITAPVTLVKQGNYTFVRAPCQLSTNTDVVWRVLFGRPANYSLVNSRTGAIDFYGIRFIPKSTAAINTIAAYNQSTHVHNQGIDEGCPIKFNSMFLSGTGHGVVGYAATKTAHDKTAVDVGSTWTDGTSTWVLTYIQDVNTVLFVRLNTGATDKWVIGTNAITGTSLTHVAGATHTTAYAFTAQVQQQLIPSIQSLVNQLTVDGVAITTDGVYTGNNVRMRELYSVINPASQQAALIAAVGAASPNYLAGAEQIRSFNEYSWNDFGAMEIRAGKGVMQAFNRNVGTINDYWGGVQLQRISKTVDVPNAGIATGVSLYVPDVATVSGYNFQSVADITANAAQVNIPKASCTNASDPASHFAVFGTLAGSYTSGHLYGVSRGEGLGIPATRTSGIANVMYFSSANKQYLVLKDSTIPASTVGDVDIATLFRAPFLPTDSSLTIPGICVTMSGVDYIYITAHQNLTNKSVQIPTRLNGKKITVVKSHANVTVVNPFFTNNQVTINVINGYGDIILRAS